MEYESPCLVPFGGSAGALIRRIEDAKKVVLVQQSANPSDPSRDFAQVIASVLDAEHN